MTGALVFESTFSAGPLFPSPAFRGRGGAHRAAVGGEGLWQ